MALSFSQKMTKRFQHIASTGQKVNEYIHETCLMIFDHAVETGDCRLVHSLYEAMPASYRRETMLTWFRRYTPIRYNTSTGKVGIVDESDKSYMPFDREAAVYTPWYTIAKEEPEEKAKKPMDFAAMLKLVQSLPAKLTKAEEDGLIPADDIESAHAIARKIKALKIEWVKPVEPANEQAKEQAAA